MWTNACPSDRTNGEVIFNAPVPKCNRRVNYITVAVLYLVVTSYLLNDSFSGDAQFNTGLAVVAWTGAFLQGFLFVALGQILRLLGRMERGQTPDAPKPPDLRSARPGGAAF